MRPSTAATCRAYASRCAASFAPAGTRARRRRRRASLCRPRPAGLAGGARGAARRRRRAHPARPAARPGRAPAQGAGPPRTKLHTCRASGAAPRARCCATCPGTSAAVGSVPESSIQAWWSPPGLHASRLPRQHRARHRLRGAERSGKGPQVREVCAFLEERLGLVPGWLLSVPVKVCRRCLARGLHEARRTGPLSIFSPAHTAFLLYAWPRAAEGRLPQAARIPLQGACLYMLDHKAAAQGYSVRLAVGRSLGSCWPTSGHLRPLPLLGSPVSPPTHRPHAHAAQVFLYISASRRVVGAAVTQAIATACPAVRAAAGRTAKALLPGRARSPAAPASSCCSRTERGALLGGPTTGESAGQAGGREERAASPAAGSAAHTLTTRSHSQQAARAQPPPPPDSTCGGGAAEGGATPCVSSAEAAAHVASQAPASAPACMQCPQAQAASDGCLGDSGRLGCIHGRHRPACSAASSRGRACAAGKPAACLSAPSAGRGASGGATLLKRWLAGAAKQPRPGISGPAERPLQPGLEPCGRAQAEAGMQAALDAGGRVPSHAAVAADGCATAPPALAVPAASSAACPAPGGASGCGASAGRPAAASEPGAQHAHAGEGARELTRAALVVDAAAPRRAACGVRVLWVSAAARRQRVATRLVDAARRGLQLAPADLFELLYRHVNRYVHMCRCFH